MGEFFVRAFPAECSPAVQLVQKFAASRELAGRLGSPVVLMNDIQPFVVADAVADFSAEEHSMALHRAARGAMVCTTDGPLRALLLSGVPHEA